jgi:hypothetical protein
MKKTGLKENLGRSTKMGKKKGKKGKKKEK